ncbi:unnamed protein product [Brassica rapa]|uniref:Uncharacterized protein n=1 Tax=Brassica campestris TaxID=3711 RepID=A0A8D9CSW3_BRACM|nr:unnamed protein product [Brassica rapa]
MNWSRSWSKVCDSGRIIPSPSRSASGPWCWVGRSVMFLFDCWLAGWPFISNPGYCTWREFEAKPKPEAKEERQIQRDWTVVWTGHMGVDKTSLGKDFISSWEDEDQERV